MTDLENSMNNESSLTQKKQYFKIVIKQRELKKTINKELDNFLLESLNLNKLQYEVNWDEEYRLYEEAFREFAISKLTKTVAYRSEIMSRSKAENYLDQFLNNFEIERKCFTNYDDLDYIIPEWKTIENYESQKSYGYGSFGFTDNVFDCSLIVMDKNKIGGILISDND